MKSPLNLFFAGSSLVFIGLGAFFLFPPDLAAQTFDGGQGFFLSSQVNRGSESIAIADLNEDGNLDLVSADNGFLNLFFGDGAGGFPSTSSLATRPSNATDTPVSDDNEHVLALEATSDGHLDLLATNLLPNFNALTLFASDPQTAGQFLEPATRITEGIGMRPAAVSAIHLNPTEDDDVDLVLVTSNPPKVRSFLGTGRGSFVPGSTTNLSSSPTSSGEGIAAGDVNHDGLLDIAVVDRQRVWILLNDGAGRLIRSGSATSSITSGEHFEFDVALGDFNGDTHLDAAVANGGIFNSLSSTQHSIAVFFGDGTGKLDPVPSSIDLGSEVADVEVGDFDNDGNLDVLAAVPDFVSTFGGGVVIRGNGDGTFDAENKVSLPALGIGTVSVATADLDKDGRLDVVLGNEGLFIGSGSDVPGTLAVYLSTLPDLGPATPTPSPTPIQTPVPSPTQSEDINGDGFINAQDLIILLEQQGNQTPNP